MTKKEVKKIAEKLILNGKTKQDIFENLKVSSNVHLEELADIIRSIPSIKSRQKYKTLNLLLFVVLFIDILYSIFYKIPIINNPEDKWDLILYLLPIYNIILLYKILRFKAGSYNLVGTVAIIGLLSTIGRVHSYEPVLVIDFVLTTSLVWMAFYLNSKLFPAFSIIKENYQNENGDGRLRKTIQFPE